MQMPAYVISIGNKKENKQLTDVEYYGFDEQEKATYFVVEKSLMDNSNLGNRDKSYSTEIDQSNTDAFYSLNPAK